jgi:hypothetical protein
VIVAVLAGCPNPNKGPKVAPPDRTSSTKQDRAPDLIAELQDDILKSYERDEAPDNENAMIRPEIGMARIGVGPGDVLVGIELARAPSRWPLDIPADTPVDPRSMRLEIKLAQDQSAAWATDEISWRIKLCGRTAVIPLRMSWLVARDGDRWVPVFEHLSFARPPSPTISGQKTPREFRTAVESRDLADELSRVVAPVLRRAIDKSPKVVAPDGSLIGPDVAAEWRGAELLGAKLIPGSEPMKLEDRRVGLVGRDHDKATIAYWIGNLTADLPARPGVPAGKGHFRATFVFERRDKAWVVVHGHVSHAIDDDNLASAIFGTALISPKPLAITCDDGSRPANVPKTTTK